jgi:energy-coupling factor transporter ATP-binding protein EcfA2
VLDRVSFKNFKSLKAVTIDLAPLTVLVGPNGSGKSSVLQGIHLLSRFGIPQPRPIDDMGPMFDPRRLATAKGSTLSMAIHDIRGDTLSLAIPIPATNDGSPIDLDFEVVVDGPAGRIVASRLDNNAPMTVPRRWAFASVVYLHLDATVMSRTSTTEDEEPRMAADGGGLASTLAWMAGAKPDVLHRIATDLARVVPGVRRILVHRERIAHRDIETITVDGQPVWRPVNRTKLGDRFSIEFDDGTEVPADLLSEGTVLALGLLTKLHEPERSRVLLLDDIDRGLHIGAQAKLVAVLRDLMKLDPELQVVCTTHSAYLLDLFDPSEVRVLDLDESRATHAKPLTAHPDFEKWRFGTQTGELWAALGDAWVTAQPEDPAP